MKKEDISRLARGCIPGIHNYCDRWCERCPMTGRCLSRALETEIGDDRRQDLDNALFWDKLSEIFSFAIELLRETGEEMDIDFSVMADETELGLAGSAGKQNVVHLAAHLAERYAAAAKAFFEASPIEKDEEPPPLRLVDSAEHRQAVAVGEALEVIEWYQCLIGVKLRRALHGRELPGDDDSPEDANGSAKVALLAIDRSISAWGVLLAAFPEQKKKILSLVRNLQDLQDKVDGEFPGARGFVRPGFDT